MTSGIRERQQDAIGASPTAARLRKLAVEFGIATVAALFMSFAGAFESARATLLPRTGYWLVVMWAGTGLGVAASWALERLESFDNRPVLTSVAVSLALTAPMTIFVWLMTAWVFQRPLTLGMLLYLVGPVLLVSLVVTGLNYMARRSPAETHVFAVADPPPVRFLDRLPFGLKGAEIHAVQAEDHYLRLHTSRGSDLILMRLADAIVELDGIEGAQTHRSWWVAKTAVTGARTADGRAVLTLKSGAEAPVSRTYVKALRQAGWW